MGCMTIISTMTMRSAIMDNAFLSLPLEGGGKVGVMMPLGARLYPFTPTAHVVRNLPPQGGGKDGCRG